MLSNIRKTVMLIKLGRQKKIFANFIQLSNLVLSITFAKEFQLPLSGQLASLVPFISLLTN